MSVNGCFLFVWVATGAVSFIHLGYALGYENPLTKLINVKFGWDEHVEGFF